MRIHSPYTADLSLQELKLRIKLLHETQNWWVISSQLIYLTPRYKSRTTSCVLWGSHRIYQRCKQKANSFTEVLRQQQIFSKSAVLRWTNFFLELDSYPDILFWIYFSRKNILTEESWDLPRKTMIPPHGNILLHVNPRSGFAQVCTNYYILVTL